MALVKFPALDLKEIIVVLKTEGGSEFANIAKTLFKDTKVFDSWARLMRLLECDICPILARGGELASLKPFIPKLVAEGKILSDAFTGFGSMIPGPIGIACSLIRAIACFYGGNIPMGLLELLGCVPGAKLGVKGGSAAARKIAERLLIILRNNKELSGYLKKAESLIHTLKGFNTGVVKNKLGKLLSNNPADSSLIKTGSESFQNTMIKPKHIKTGSQPFLSITMGSRLK